MIVYTNKIDGIASVAARFGWGVRQLALLHQDRLGPGAHAKLSVVDSVGHRGRRQCERVAQRLQPSGRASNMPSPAIGIVGFESNYYRFESKSYEIGGGDGF